MKKIVALLLAVIMMLGCFTFAEETQDDAAIHQEMFIDALLAADEGFEMKDLTTNVMSYLANHINSIFVVYDKLTAEQVDELNAVSSAIFAEAVTMQMGDGEKLAELIDSKIDAMQTVGVVAKANFKSIIMENMLTLASMNESERTLVSVVLDSIYEIVNEATPEERVEISKGIYKAFGMLPFGLHDARDNLITLYNQTSSMVDQLGELSDEYDMDGHVLGNAYVYAYKTVNNPLSDEDRAMAKEVLADMTEEISALDLGDGELSEEEIAAIEEIAHETIAANFASLDEDQHGMFVDFVLSALNESRELDPRAEDVLGIMVNSFKYLLEVADEETLADIALHIANIEEALDNNDTAALAADLEPLFSHIAENREDRLYETIAQLTDEEAIAVGMKLIFKAWLWNTQPDMLGVSVMDVIEENDIDLTDVSDENVEGVGEILGALFGEVTEGFDDTSFGIADTIEVMADFDGLTDDEQNNIEHLINSTLLALEYVPGIERVGIDTTIEKIYSEIDMSEERHDVSNLANLVSLNYGEDTEERLAQLDDLSMSAKVFVIDAMAKEYEIYKRLPAEYRGMIAEMNKAVDEIVAALDLKGIDTDPAVYDQLEEAINELLSVYPNVPPFVMASLATQVAVQALNFSGFSAEEQEIVNTVLDNIDQILAEGDEEAIDMIDDFLHNVQHMVFDYEVVE